jgi:hypothetical protein
MKIDVLALLGPKKSVPMKGKVSAGFEATLKSRMAPAPESDVAPETKTEKKPRKFHSTEEALLVSRAVMARAPLVFLTKPSELKVGPPHVDSSPRLRGTVPALTAEPVHPAVKKGVAVVRQERPDSKDKKETDELTRALGEDVKPTAAKPTESFQVEPPVALKDAAPLAHVAPLILDDSSIRAVLLPTIARISLDTGELGKINLQLKVHDGITDVRAQGTGAQILEARQGEIRVALAREGLALGHFDLTQSGSQHPHNPYERPEAEAVPPAARRLTTTTEIADEAGRVHIKA